MKKPFEGSSKSFDAFARKTLNIACAAKNQPPFMAWARNSISY